MVAREGLEPSKPLGRQIYSLLRLTASLPRQLAVYWKTGCVGLPKSGETVDGAGEGIRTPDLLITNQLLYQTELRQPRQKVNFSTSHATLQVSGGLGYCRGGPSVSARPIATREPPIVLISWCVAEPPRTARCRRRPTRSGFE